MKENEKQNNIGDTICRYKTLEPLPVKVSRGEVQMEYSNKI